MKFVYEFQEILKLFLRNSRNRIKPIGEFIRVLLSSMILII